MGIVVVVVVVVVGIFVVVPERFSTPVTTDTEMRTLFLACSLQQLSRRNSLFWAHVSRMLHRCSDMTWLSCEQSQEYDVCLGWFR